MRNAPGVLVALSVLVVAAWAVFLACAPPPLPAEPPYVETVAMNRDR